MGGAKPSWEHGRQGAGKFCPSYAGDRAIRTSYPSPLTFNRGACPRFSGYEPKAFCISTSYHSRDTSIPEGCRGRPLSQTGTSKKCEKTRYSCGRTQEEVMALDELGVHDAVLRRSIRDPCLSKRCFNERPFRQHVFAREMAVIRALQHVRDLRFLNLSVL